MISLNRLDHKIHQNDTAGVLDDLYGRIADRFAGRMTQIEGHAEHVEMAAGLQRPSIGRLPLPIRVRLINCPAGAWALALDRVLGLTYGASDLIEDLVRRIEDEVAFDHSAMSDPVVAACVAAAAHRLMVEDRPGCVAILGRMTALRDRALNELADCQDETGLLRGDLDRTEDDALLTTAFAASLVAGAPEARMAICWSALLGALEEHEHRLPAAARSMAR